VRGERKEFGVKESQISAIFAKILRSLRPNKIFGRESTKKT